MKIKILFLVLLFSLIFNIFINAQQNRDIIKIKFIGGLSTDFDFTSNKNYGFWGFVDESVETQYFSGYKFGIIIGFNFLKYVEPFIDLTILKSSLLMGKAGSRLKGIAIWDADPNHTSSLSPLLPNDIYYISKATMGRMGLKFILPTKINVGPYAGFALGVVPYEIAFGNKDGTRAYSEIISDVVTIFSLVFGTEFNLEVFTLGLFFEYGGAATEVGVVMNDWIWQGWTYHAQFPIVPAFRGGITLSF